MKSSKIAPRTSHAVSQKLQFYVQPTAVSAGSPPVVRRLFEVNSEPHTGARPSVRLCVGLINHELMSSYSEDSILARVQL
jgi:hypothetical protein